MHLSDSGTGPWKEELSHLKSHGLQLGLLRPYHSLSRVTSSQHIYIYIFFRAVPTAYAGYRGSKVGIKSELQLLAYTTAHSNAGSLTH